MFIKEVRPHQPSNPTKERDGKNTVADRSRNGVGAYLPGYTSESGPAL